MWESANSLDTRSCDNQANGLEIPKHCSCMRASKLQLSGWYPAFTCTILEISVARTQLCTSNTNVNCVCLFVCLQEMGTVCFTRPLNTCWVFRTQTLCFGKPFMVFWKRRTPVSLELASRQSCSSRRSSPRLDSDTPQWYEDLSRPGAISLLFDYQMAEAKKWRKICSWDSKMSLVVFMQRAKKRNFF